MGFYRSLALLYPPSYRKSISELVLAANVKVDQDSFLGFFMIVIFALSLSFSFLVARMLGINIILVFLGLFIIMHSTFYLLLLLSADKKTKAIEEVLPDALQLMGSNLRAGISIEKSLILAARPEFGPLKDEIEAVAKDVATGKDVGEALKGMSQRVRSKPLQRIVQLIIMGLKSGGKLATLLENCSEDLRAQKEMKDKINSSVQTYVIFIFVASGVGAPMLFALSLFLVEVIIKSFAGIEIPATSSIPISLGKVTISTDFLTKFIITALCTTSTISAFMLGMISKGKAKEGAKYIVALISMSLGLFFLGSYILASVFGGLFAM
ncbi:MAG: type II secretion system F family protein [Candidatus Woesearchaeota archaeon]